jgi:phytoene dehydrogenase-like protein
LSEAARDAIVIGGGHNGLVAAAYLARAGARTLLLEARDVVGGAAVTEAPWPAHPKVRISSLSYVVSLIPDTIVTDLKLAEHGYRVHPQGPTYVPFPDGSSLKINNSDPTRDFDQASRFSYRDAERLKDFYEWLDGIAALLGPLLRTVPPAIGSRRPADLVDQGRLLWRLRKLDARGAADVSRLMTMSVTDLLDDWFESDQIKAALAINGIIGTWAGPGEPGTAYVMLHHSIGEVGDGQLGHWGFPEGGMGAVTHAIERAALSLGAEVRTGARVSRILTADGRATGVALDDGTELRAEIVVTAVHPKLAFVEMIDSNELPDEFVSDIKRYRTRSGTVKINLMLAELPEFIPDPGIHAEIQGGAMELAHSAAYLESAFQDARAGAGATRPFSSGVIPSFVDNTLTPEGVHVMSLFTQWVPHTWASQPRRDALQAYADRVVDGYTELAPNFKKAIVERQVIGPHEMERDYGLIGGNIFHGELSPDQLFHLRPASGYADYTTPIENLYQCGSSTHAGGGVNGIPALNCVRRILSMHRRKRWGS